MKTKVIITALILSLFICPLYSLEKKYSPKNKPLALLLSMVSPGMGQMYEGKLEEGLTIWGTSTVLALTLLTVIGEVDLYSSWIPIVRYRLKPTLTSDEIFWAIGIGATYLILYVYNIIDVAIYEEKPISVKMDHEQISLNYSIRF